MARPSSSFRARTSDRSKTEPCESTAGVRLAPGVSRQHYSAVRWVRRGIGAAALSGLLVACAAISGLDGYSAEGDCVSCGTSADASVPVDATSAHDGGDSTTTAVTDAAAEAESGDAGPTEDANEPVCEAGLASCDGGCVSLASVDNCGNCGKACATEDPNAQTTCTDGTCGFVCDPGYSFCNGACVQYSSAANCGSCGSGCDADAGTPLCAATADGGYSCVPSCPAATPTLCSDACVDTTSDRNNCHDCGSPCTTTVGHAEAVCVHSACTFACESGYQLCNGACVQYTGAANCGSCGNACTGDGGAAVCAGSNGSYTCVSGCPAAAPALCSGSCVDITSDPNNCSGCGIGCAVSVANSQPACEDGGCTFTCAAGTSLCNGACVQYTTASNCGGCGTTCAGDGGTPVCAAGQDGGAYSCASGCPAGANTRCSGGCVDTGSDTNNCGTCGHACTTNVPNAKPACALGACSFTCGTGYSLCNAACANFTNDPNNCGGCGSAFACAGGMTCQNGHCSTSCRIASDCPAGYACNGSTCTTSCSQSQTCNGGCCAGGTCVVGSAAAACGTNGGACTDCATQANNNACVGGICGCATASDCAALNACSMAIHLCQQLCGGANTGCNGGCCSNLSTGGQCEPGNVDTQCGGTGGQCENCQSACGPGPHCLGNVCGCNNSLDCLAFSSCGSRTTCNASNACQ